MIADVYISTRPFRGVNVTMEWYFMTDGFVVQENLGVGLNEPILNKFIPQGDAVNN
jgi:hypothetical protein